MERTSLRDTVDAVLKQIEEKRYEAALATKYSRLQHNLRQDGKHSILVSKRS